MKAVKSKIVIPATNPLLLLLLVLLPVASIWLGLRFLDRNQLDSAYRYNLVRPPSGSVTLELGKEISFYQQRIRQNPAGGLDRAVVRQTNVGLVE